MFCCDPSSEPSLSSSEPSQRDGSDEGSQHTVSMRIKKKLSLTYHQISLLSRALAKMEMAYRKNSKNWDTLNYYRDCPTNGIVGFYSAILRSKDADRITNRVDTDQTAPQGAV